MNSITPVCLLLALQLALSAVSCEETAGQLLAKALNITPARGEELIKIIPETKKLITKKMEQRQWEGALEAADGLLKEVAHRVEKSQNHRMLSWLVSLRYNRLEILLELGRYLEAMIEALYLRYDCITFKVCDKKIAEDLMPSMLRYVEQGYYSYPNVPKTKSDFKRLIRIVHPDKNQKLDAESLKWLSTVFNQIKALHDKAQN